LELHALPALEAEGAGDVPLARLVGMLTQEGEERVAVGQAAHETILPTGDGRSAIGGLPGRILAKVIGGGLPGGLPGRRGPGGGLLRGRLLLRRCLRALRRGLLRGLLGLDELERLFERYRLG